MGRRVFTAGHLVTAAELNDVAAQTVQIFADAAARTAGYPAADPPATGELSMLADTLALQVYSGTAWTDLMRRPARTRPAFTFGPIPSRRSVSQTPDQVLTVDDIAAGNHSNKPVLAIVGRANRRYDGLTSDGDELIGIARRPVVDDWAIYTLDTDIGGDELGADLTISGTNFDDHIRGLGSLDGTLYVLTNNSNAVGSLYTLDPDDEEMTLVANITGNAPTDLTSFDGTLYTVLGRTIYSIDATTAAKTSEMTVSATEVRYLFAISSYRGRLWCLALKPTGSSDIGYARLLRIDDLSTAAVTFFDDARVSPIAGCLMAGHDQRLWVALYANFGGQLTFLCRAVPW